MIDELRDQEIIRKVGGKFKLSTLIQKRMIALKRGARPLVNMPGATDWEIVIQEIMQDKIYLSLQNELQTIEDDLSLDISQEIDFDSI
ncbi:MAG: DNA-directed RNA polymerase subunit omega [Planctomycetia bacterium]|nr:DNA-directed RNA polymerase subunit omega [Planctomycetia bacterium]